MSAQSLIDGPVLAIGQFPPPVHGFSYITRCLSDEVQQLRVVREIDITGSRKARGLLRHVSRALAAVGAAFSILRARREGATCYVACEGGLGLVYSWVVIAAARITGMPTLLHHHSFAYIERRSALMRLVVGTHPDICHIFLCCTMQGKFEAVYRRGGDGAVLSNAAFVPPDDGASDDVREEAEGLVIGLLSNLTREKGLYRFLELLRVAAERGVAVRGVLAGPVALDEDRAALARAQAELGDRLDYRGPLYGPDKAVFYRDIDVFVFPTDYANEAQPTVLFEALAAGCRIVSYDRGCIANQVEDDGLVIPRDRDFVAAAMDWLVLATRPRSMRGDIITRYAARHARARGVIHGLFGPASHECLSSCAD